MYDDTKPELVVSEQRIEACAVAAATLERLKLKLIAEYDPMLRNHLTAVLWFIYSPQSKTNSMEFIAENFRSEKQVLSNHLQHHTQR